MPGFQCTFKDCGSDSSSIGISLFQFPKSDPELQQWIDFVKKYPGWQPKPSSRLCSLHFRASEFKHNGKRLKEGAVPTVSIDMEVDDDEFELVVTEGEKSYSETAKTKKFLMLGESLIDFTKF